jgi:hypothetical protein
MSWSSKAPAGWHDRHLSGGDSLGRKEIEHIVNTEVGNVDGQLIEVHVIWRSQ